MYCILKACIRTILHILQPPQSPPVYCVQLWSSDTLFQPCLPDNACCPMGLQTTIRAISGAYEQIDHAISEALYQSKPVLIQVASNMASLTHPLFEEQPVPFSMTGKTTNEVSFMTRESDKITSIITYSLIMTSIKWTRFTQQSVCNVCASTIQALCTNTSWYL